MVYAGRSIDSLPFTEEVARFGDRVEIRTDDVSGVPTAEELLGDCPDGHNGVRLRARADADGDPRRSWPDATTSSCTSNASLRHRSSTAREFSVSIASSGRDGTRRRRRDAADRRCTARTSHAPYSCQQGFCGTCRTRGASAGAVDHRDTLLTDPERDGGMMLICISRASGRASHRSICSPSVLFAHAAGRWCRRSLATPSCGCSAPAAWARCYLAQHPRLPRRDALKVLPADVSADSEYRQRFNREADIAATLWHPHIVGVHDRGDVRGPDLDLDGLCGRHRRRPAAA